MLWGIKLTASSTTSEIGVGGGSTFAVFIRLSEAIGNHLLKYMNFYLVAPNFLMKSMLIVTFFNRLNFKGRLVGLHVLMF